MKQFLEQDLHATGSFEIFETLKMGTHNRKLTSMRLPQTIFYYSRNAMWGVGTVISCNLCHI